MGDLYRSFYGIVISDSDVIHAFHAGSLVNMLGLGKAFRAIELPERPTRRLVRVAGVYMQICPVKLLHLT